MALVTYYEIYLFKNGDWELHGRYPSDQKREALIDAKQVEETLGLPSKIIKDSFDTATGDSDESVIYISEKIRSGVVSNRSQGGGNTYWDSSGSNYTYEQESEISKAKFSAAIIKLIAIILISIFLSAITALLLTFIYSHSSGAIGTTQDNAKILFVLFIVSFVFMAPPLAMNFVPWEDIENFSSSKKKKEKKKDKKSSDDSEEIDDDSWFTRALMKVFNVPTIFGEKNNIEEEESDDDDDDNEKDTNNEEKESSESEIETTSTFMDSFSLDEDDFDEEEYDDDDENVFDDSEDDEEINDGIEQKKNKKDPKSKKEKTKNNSDEFDEDEYDEEEDEDFVQDLYNEAEVQRKILMKFLGNMVSAIKSKYQYVDAFGKFGINLALAGACSALRYYNKIPENLYKKLLAEFIELLGTNQHLAEAFIENINEYMLEPRNMLMVEIGHSAMEEFLKEPKAANYSKIIEALGKWNAPNSTIEKDADKDKNKKGIVAVMFTDMVDSTISTQDLGDSAAQELVRVHNKIVREALDLYSGEEVKHTGDGIMASFSSTSNAVDASVLIQQKISDYNQNNELKLNVRVGINAGEPIVEDNDLFGTTVQIASRICNIADKDKIYVSNVVKELAAGKSYQFYNHGPITLKGIKDPQIVHEVIWSDDDIIEEKEEDKTISIEESTENPEEKKEPNKK